MLNTEKKLLQATNQKLTHARAKILFLKMKVCVPTLEHGNEEINPLPVALNHQEVWSGDITYIRMSGGFIPRSHAPRGNAERC